jgi:hypothetical protein
MNTIRDRDHKFMLFSVFSREIVMPRVKQLLFFTKL